MPKYLVFSDLHIPVNHGAPPVYVPEEVDAVIVAGDIAAPISQSMSWLSAEVASQGKPVIFTAGNHEHYGQVLENSMASGRVSKSIYPDVHWLENEAVVIDGVRFLGCTLWTDYDLYERREVAMQASYLGLNDHRAIRSFQSIVGEVRDGVFTPEQSLAMHRESRAWLEERLSESFDGKTVVVTHHAPHSLSVAPKFKGDPLTPAFVSDLTDIIEKHQPDLWVHGHTHASFDYVVPGTRTRVVCNPRGYGDENPAFRLHLTVEI